MAFPTRTLLRALLLGFLSWLFPFFLGFGLFPLKKANPPLFTTLMYLEVLVTAGYLMGLYFRKRQVSTHEAIAVGGLWLSMNLLFDYPMFAFGPMKMTPLTYYSEIGLVYLTYPIFGLLATRMAKP